ncbi:hypothetical protein R84B8_00631 [Treponema sp. R8-4-B8]
MGRYSSLNEYSVFNNLLTTFMTIDLSAGIIFDIPFKKVNIFLAGLPYLASDTADYTKFYAENNTNDPIAFQALAAGYALKAIDLAAEIVYIFDNKYTPNDSNDERILFLAQNVNSAFSTVLPSHHSYLKDKLHDLILSDIYKLSKNITDEFDNDFSIYDGLWMNFKNNLNKIGFDFWFDTYDNLYNNNFKIDMEYLSIRVEEYDKIISEETPTDWTRRVSDTTFL